MWSFIEPIHFDFLLSLFNHNLLLSGKDHKQNNSLSGKVFKNKAVLSFYLGKIKNFSLPYILMNPNDGLGLNLECLHYMSAVIS